MCRTRGEFTHDLTNLSTNIRMLFNNKLPTTDGVQEWVVTIKPIEFENKAGSCIGISVIASQVLPTIIGEDLDYCKGYMFWKINSELAALIDRRWPGLSFTKDFSLVEVKPEFKELCFTTVWSNHESTSQAFGDMLIEMKVTGMYNATAGSLDMVNVMLAIKTRF